MVLHIGAASSPLVTVIVFEMLNYRGERVALRRINGIRLRREVGQELSFGPATFIYFDRRTERHPRDWHNNQVRIVTGLDDRVSFVDVI